MEGHLKRLRARQAAQKAKEELAGWVRVVNRASLLGVVVVKRPSQEIADVCVTSARPSPKE